MSESLFALEFYRSNDGDEPVRRWMRRRLPTHKRRALAAALRLVLAVHGIDVCGSPYGRHLGHGLFEFRLDEDEATLFRKWGPEAVSTSGHGDSSARILLRVFCHATGDRVILILGGYDKGRDPSPRKQQGEIAKARARLTESRARG